MVETFRSWAVLHRLTILLIVLNLYDFWTTKYIVSLAGSSAEINPAMRWIIEEYSIWGILWFKIAALAFVWGMCTLTNKNGRILKPHNAHIVIGGLCVPLGIICVWNSLAIYQMSIV